LNGNILSGRIALISGVGPGLGSDIARLFAKHGADLLLTARSIDRLKAIAAELSESGVRCLIQQCDVSSVDACEAAVARTVAEFGRIDVLVNVAYASDGWHSLLETSQDMEDWHRAFDINVFGTMAMTRAAAKAMIAHERGTIVTVNSMLSAMNVPQRGGYQGSKAALATMTRTAALELAAHGIRVNGLHPGWMAGEPVEQAFVDIAARNGTTAEAERRKILDQIPLGYIPTTSEYARIALFLASDFSAPITGQCLHANGGQWLS